MLLDEPPQRARGEPPRLAGRTGPLGRMPREQIKSQRPDNDAKPARRSPPFGGKSTPCWITSVQRARISNRSRRVLKRNGAARRQGTRYCSSDRCVPSSALRYALPMFRPFRAACPRGVSRSDRRASIRRRGAPCSSGAVRGRAFLLGALLLSAWGCGQDVLVARWTLLSDAPDASPGGDTDADAGLNQQSIHAQRARDRARMRESMNDGHTSSDDKSH
jgi:hypothetical protein